MISSEREVAIDRVNETCIRAGDHYEKFAESIEKQALQHWFGALARCRRDFSTRLQERIRAMGHLPSAPDPDREELERLGVRLKALVSDNGDAALLEKCREIEEELLAAVDEAAGFDLPEPLRALLAEIRDDVRQTGRRLDARRKEAASG